MDSIEKAMFGKSLGQIAPSPTVAQPIFSKQSNTIERTASITTDPTVVRGSESATKKRTQRSVTLDMER